MSSNWCPDIYKGLFIDRVNNDRIRLAPCCQADATIEPIADFDFVTSPALTQIREQFDQGQQPKACDRCWKNEALGAPSRREVISRIYKESDRSIGLENLTYSSTWACNLACIMCNEQFSSTWALELGTTREELEQIGRAHNKSLKFLEQLDISNLRHLHFNGGEPLLNDDHLLILQQADKLNILNSLALSYNTNGTQYPSVKAMDYWKRSKLVRLWFSIDGTDRSYEYIRYHGNWAQDSANISKICDTVSSNVKFGFNVTVGCYNLFELPAVLAWYQEHMLAKYPASAVGFNWQFAYNFDPKVLNDAAKQDAIALLAPYTEFAGIVAHLKAWLGHSNNSWIDRLEITDQRRGTNWRNSLHVAKYY